MEDRIIAFNPLDHIEIPKITHDDKKIKFFTRDQLEKLLTYL